MIAAKEALMDSEKKPAKPKYVFAKNGENNHGAFAKGQPVPADYPALGDYLNAGIIKRG